jgi:hypothetical protein
MNLVRAISVLSPSSSAAGPQPWVLTLLNVRQRPDVSTGGKGRDGRT